MSLYSSLTQVLAPFAAKINGLLTGWDGTKYSTPGEAVRDQIWKLHVLIGDEPGTAISASAISYGESDVETALDTVNGRLNDLKSDLSESVENLKSVIDNPIIESIVFEQGNINSSGAEASDSSRIRTKYLACPLGFSFTVPNGYKTYIYGFTAQEQSSITGAVFSNWKTGEVNTAGFDGKYIRIILAKTDNTALTPSSTPSISITRNTTTDRSLSIQDMSADAKETGDKFDQIISSIGVNGSMSILFEHGSIGSNGLDSDYNKESRIRTSMLEFGTTIVFKAKDTTQDNAFIVAYYNADGTKKELSSWVKTITIAKNNKFRIVASLTPSTNTAENISTILSAFQYTFDFADNETLHNYYFENDYIDNKVATLQSYYSLSPKLVMFGFITDTHMRVNAGQSFKLIKYIDNHSNSVPFVVCGGDIIGHTDSIDDVYEQETKWIDMMSDYGKRFVLHCRGNHDLLGDQNDSYLDRSSRYNFIMRNQQIVIPSSNNFYYYYDIPFTDTRIIVVDDFDGAATGGAAKFTQTQLDWILNTALNTNNKNIVFISHITPDPDMGWYEENMQPLQFIMDALKQKTNLNTMSMGFNLIHDFTNTTNNIICCICGHGHNDENHTDSAGVLTIMTNCDGNASSTSGYTRTVNTVNEQCFDIVSIDVENKQIYMTRIGAGNDRQFSYA